ncbi:nuclear transport factor 2 family protein [Sphingomonas nostoxanthinifaciens]|uniref:nuclear transport factor 2 family protein n=1 Tax=Sphingomonas nostoxanthinifaciens TaxID=2872652 RepID=UPI001CC1FE9F|nr:nuclear transport factor 2 family protein [Sphingomonas nostoxanthinifaciens]UAK24021.1 nuclear transport factor 2 family protein [Sphingomonas nostoxanthinifaciens]
MRDGGTPIDSRLAALLDIEEIRRLRMRYAHCLDSGNFEGFDRVFTPDAVVAVLGGEMAGLPAIKADLAEAYRLYDRDGRKHYPFVHAITNHEVTLAGDEATGRCCLIDFETAPKPDPNPLLLLGIYADQYRRIDGAWRISGSQLEVVWKS